MRASLPAKLGTHGQGLTYLALNVALPPPTVIMACGQKMTAGSSQSEQTDPF
jgi:hypothetical protein